MSVSKFKKPTSKYNKEDKLELMSELTQDLRVRGEKPSAQLVAVLMSQGLTKEDVAKVIGVTARQMRNYCKEDENLRKAYEVGETILKNQIVQKAVEMALDGDKDMIKFLLKSKFGFSESKKIEITGKDGGDININNKYENKDEVMAKIFKTTYKRQNVLIDAVKEQDEEDDYEDIIDE